MEINNLEKNNQIEINNEIVNEQEQKSFLETTLGRVINTGIDIGIRAILPDFIEDQIIEIKDTLLEKLDKLLENRSRLSSYSCKKYYVAGINDIMSIILNRKYQN